MVLMHAAIEKGVGHNVLQRGQVPAYILQKGEGQKATSKQGAWPQCIPGTTSR